MMSYDNDCSKLCKVRETIPDIGISFWGNPFPFKIHCPNFDCLTEYELRAEDLPFECSNCHKWCFWLMEGWLPTGCDPTLPHNSESPATVRKEVKECQ